LHSTKKKENQEGKNGKAGLPPEQVQHSAEQIMVASQRVILANNRTNFNSN